MRPKSLIGWLGLGAFVVGLAGAILVFVEVQVLQSYPFYQGAYGNESLLWGITYTIILEIFSSLAFVGLFSWAFSKAEGMRGERLSKAAGTTLLVLGILVAVIVYVETSLLWGEVLPGVHLWQGFPGGGGYPWGTEQVAYNTCLIASSVQGDCTFLNYNELFLLALLSAIVGYILNYSSPNERADYE